MKRIVLVAAMAASAAHAEDQAQLHNELPPEIVVTAPYLRDRADLLTGVSVLQGTRLQTELRPTIGETLARLPGVSATSFGPNSSRPILRGLDAERVRILTDGIGSFDVSNTSVDHAVALNPLLTERVEVIRGPSALLYGSGALGGVVNVIDRRIPREMPAEPVHLDALGTFGSAATERSGGAAIDVPVGSRLVVHADGSYLRTNDLRIGGFRFSEPLRAAAREAGLSEEADARGRLPNTSSRTWTAGGGFAIITPRGQLGVAYGRYESDYGVPNRLELGGEDHDHDHDDHDHDHDHEHGHGHEDIRLKVRQDRVDARAEVEMDGVFERVRVRAGFADYVHDEVEPGGEIGTTFTNRAVEARLELVQRARGGWRGALGAQFFARDFAAFGEEAYVPRNSTEQTGLFTVQEFRTGPVRLELGGRFERTNVNSDEIGVHRRFDAWSAAAGASIDIGPRWRLGVNYNHTQRAPSAEELFADGPHAATQAYERGDPGFAKERGDGIEATLRGRLDGFRFEASAYYTRFRDYIFLAATGEEEDELPLFTYRQAGARYMGVEAEGTARLARFGEAELNVDALVDWTRASIIGEGPVPRVPPLRVLGGVEAVAPAWSVRAEVEHATRQSRVADFETETPAFTLVNLSASLRPFGDANRTTLVLSVNNLFDVEARRHTSFLKDFAPLAGRDIRLSLRVSL